MRYLRILFLWCVFATLAGVRPARAASPAQLPPTVQDPDTADRSGDPKLPSGRSQREEILRNDHEKSLEDAQELQKLTEELRVELEKNDRHILAVSTLKKLDQIEKLTRRIRGRLKRF